MVGLDPSSFPVIGRDGKSAHFIFANLNGSISAWDAGATAFVQATNPGAIYAGPAIYAASTQLFAANAYEADIQATMTTT